MRGQGVGGLRRVVEEQRGTRSSSEEGSHRCVDELEHTFAMLSAGRHRCPNAFQPAAARFASAALRNLAIDYHEANRLLREIVGGLDAGRRHEVDVLNSVIVKSLG